MTYAKVIADSTYAGGPRLTTLEVRFHRFVLAEFNTHRVFSRNSASSRAIPVAKQIDRVRTDPAAPVSWPAEQRGMQGGDELEGDRTAYARQFWANTADQAALNAEVLAELGLHKSVTNRLLEPFMWHTVVVTSAAWENFFAQRCNPLAQPEIRVAAEAMRDAIAGGTPEELKPGQWHLPYFQDGDYDVVADLDDARYRMPAEISAARCARVSYLTQDGRRDVHEDLALFERLTTAQPAHWSPLEHVATPWPENQQDGYLMVPGTDNGLGQSRRLDLGHLPKIGNLLGWRSLRTETEAAQDQVTFR